MPRDLTSDITEPAITHVCLDQVDVLLKRNTDFTVRAEASELTVRFNLYSADGVSRRSVGLRRPGDQIPAAVVTAYRAFHAALLTAAQAAGVIPPGTDTQDL